MEEQMELDAIKSKLQIGSKNNVPRFYFIKLLPSPKNIGKEEAAKQYQLLTIARSLINGDIEQRKGDAYQIYRKLMWFTQHDQYIQWKMQEINNLERYLGKVEPHLQTNSVPRTTGFFRLSEKDVGAGVISNGKRSKKRMIKKGRLDTQYLQRVQEELLSSKKSGGMTSSGSQVLNDLIESMAQRIHHGNKSRADEMRIYHKMRNIQEKREMYTAPDPEPKRNSNWYSRERKSKRDIDSLRFVHHKINIRLDDIEDLKMDLKGREARVTRLKAELEHVRKSISCLQKELEDVNTRRINAYKHAYELEEQNK